MKLSLRLFVFFIIILGFLSCRFDNNGHDMGQTSFLKIDNARLDTSIARVLSEIPDSIHDNVRWLKLIYTGNHYKNLWVTPGNIRKCDTLLIFLRKAESHGLNPGFFIPDSLKHQIRLVKTERLSYYELARIDIQITFSYLNYANALIYGLIQPEDRLRGYHFRTASMDTVFVSRLLSHHATGLFGFLNAMQVVDTDYELLRNERNFWTQFKNDSFPQIPYLPAHVTLKKGQSNGAIIPSIIRRLKITGELNVNFPDTNSILNAELFTALDKFRLKNGLKPGDELGNFTIQNLNMTTSDWLNKVDVNLERYRWKTIIYGKRKFVRVNVAAMSLDAVRNDTVVLHSKVCVGKMPENKTPFLQSKIVEVILNPVWSVPSSIIVKEISQTVQKDTAYFKRNNIKVFHKGSRIDPGNVDWSKISKTNQPFRMVQDAGERNSLGRIKFNFPNPFGVYLHDTNSKSAFLRFNRAVSHGCVRVEKPLELTYFCCPELDYPSDVKDAQQKILMDKIRHAINLPVVSPEGKMLLSRDSLQLKSNRLWLVKSIPLLIDYRTCYADFLGNIAFVQDVYGMDSVLLRVMSESQRPVNLFH